MGTLSAFHWLVIGVIVLLLFGNRLPSVMRSLGRGMVEFKKGMEGIEDDIRDTGRKIEDSAASKPSEPVKHDAQQEASQKS
jgi:sec-independent protein translocase protein TatA